MVFTSSFRACLIQLNFILFHFILWRYVFMLASFLAGAATVIDLSTVDFTPIVDAINNSIPAVLTAIIPIVGTRKVISFVMGAVKGA